MQGEGRLDSEAGGSGGGSPAVGNPAFDEGSARRTLPKPTPITNSNQAGYGVAPARRSTHTAESCNLVLLALLFGRESCEHLVQRLISVRPRFDGGEGVCRGPWPSCTAAIHSRHLPIGIRELRLLL